MFTFFRNVKLHGSRFWSRRNVNQKIKASSTKIFAIRIQTSRWPGDGNALWFSMELNHRYVLHIGLIGRSFDARIFFFVQRNEKIGLLEFHNVKGGTGVYVGASAFPLRWLVQGLSIRCEIPNKRPPKREQMAKHSNWICLFRNCRFINPDG